MYQIFTTSICNHTSYYTRLIHSINRILTVAIFQILFVFLESTHYIVFVLLEIVSKDFQLLPLTEYEANAFLQVSDFLTHPSATFQFDLITKS